MTAAAPWALFRGSGGGALLFEAPAELLVARESHEVAALLAALDANTAAGRWAAGYLAYEAAPGIDGALATCAPAALPLAAFVVVDRPRRVRWEAQLPPAADVASKLAWRPSVDESTYDAQVGAVRDAIARGDTYQVNLTWRLRAPFDGDPRALLAALLAVQPVRRAACVDLGDHALCCASPELFFARRHDVVVCRPMKGTAPRGRFAAEDARIASELVASAKQRAENLMIVDMVRNDLGRVADAGSVRTARLFAAERYATLWQLTSTVVGRSRAPFSALIGALFPSASITGAPKARTMELIRDLEGEPRGAYTGAIGWVGPRGRAHFQVAIRTAWVDRARGTVEYGTGGGITWASSAAEEHAESRLKALVLSARPAPRALLETLRWTPRRGYVLLAAHLARLRESARYFGLSGSAGAAAALAAAATRFDARPQRVRLLLHRDGRLEVEAQPLALRPRARWRVALATKPVDAADPLLFHKTSERSIYDDARSARPELDDVLLWNRSGELTESTVANVVLRLGGELMTPAVASGLLPGTLRGALLARGRVREAVVPVEALADASAIWLVSSVRGWVRAELVAR